MNLLAILRKAWLIFPVLVCDLPAQTGFMVQLQATEQFCQPGEAYVAITGTVVTQTVTVLWSTGHENTAHIYDLTAGDYNVRITVSTKHDTLITASDTLIQFGVGKEPCKVSLPKYFSPNGDGYNDILNVGNVDNYPNFEFQVFNKWGQRVHEQRKTYRPWDGTWAGVALPDGTYYYIFLYDASNKEEMEKGDLTIIR